MLKMSLSETASVAVTRSGSTLDLRFGDELDEAVWSVFVALILLIGSNISVAFSFASNTFGAGPMKAEILPKETPLFDLGWALDEGEESVAVNLPIRDLEPTPTEGNGLLAPLLV